MLEGEYLIHCPRCGSRDEVIERIHRSRFEQICRRNPKFFCTSCKNKFYRKIIFHRL